MVNPIKDNNPLHAMQQHVEKNLKDDMTSEGAQGLLKGFSVSILGDVEQKKHSGPYKLVKSIVRFFQNTFERFKNFTPGNPVINETSKYHVIVTKTIEELRSDLSLSKNLDGSSLQKVKVNATIIKGLIQGLETTNPEKINNSKNTDETISSLKILQKKYETLLSQGEVINNDKLKDKIVTDMAAGKEKLEQQPLGSYVLIRRSETEILKKPEEEIFTVLVKMPNGEYGTKPIEHLVTDNKDQLRSNKEILEQISKFDELSNATQIQLLGNHQAYTDQEKKEYPKKSGFAFIPMEQSTTISKENSIGLFIADSKGNVNKKPIEIPASKNYFEEIQKHLDIKNHFKENYLIPTSKNTKEEIEAHAILHGFAIIPQENGFLEIHTAQGFQTQFGSYENDVLKEMIAYLGKENIGANDALENKVDNLLREATELNKKLNTTE